MEWCEGVKCKLEESHQESPAASFCIWEGFKIPFIVK